jgi:hypothetical protein
MSVLQSKLMKELIDFRRQLKAGVLLSMSVPARTVCQTLPAMSTLMMQQVCVSKGLSSILSSIILYMIPTVLVDQD